MTSNEEATSRKRQRAEAETSSSAPPPKYGSKEYWEQRYAKQFQTLSSSQEKSKTVDDETTSPYHSWYFTYDELRPILLPILLGGREEARNLIVENNNCDDESEEEMEEEDEEASGDEEEGADGTECPKEVKAMKSPKENTPTNGFGALSFFGDKEEKDIEEDEEDVEEEEEDIEEEEEEEEEDEEEEEVERDGLALHGPVSVLEIGCGDVPLGGALAMELKELEDTTGAPASSIVTEIICTDYSQVVVDMMKKQYCKRSAKTHSDGDKKEETESTPQTAAPSWDIGNVPLEFVTADARKMPYADQRFALVIEKGTLDAMLSDNEHGVADCVSIVAECARVVTTGGCIVLISHLNAHTANGVGWLEDVVFAGVRKNGGDDAWAIEVHGNAEVVDDDEDPRVPPGSSGPAVYIIHKKKKELKEEGSAQDEPTIPVKFFSY